MNPCGRAVDIGREFNTRKAPGKLFTDSGEEVDVIWYPALPDAPDLGRVSLVARPEWDADGQTWLEGGVEELGEWIDKKAIPGALGAHVCGTDAEFKDGCKRDESLPDVLYGASGLPSCCDGPVLGAAGGAMGGQAEVVWEVVPGETCATATEADIAIPLTIRIPAGRDAWLRYPVAASTALACRQTDLPFLTGTAWNGTACGAWTHSYFLTWFGADCVSFPVFNPPYVWLHFQAPADADAVFTLTVTLGEC